MTMITTIWEDDILTKDIINRLKENELIDSREFLRPIFKWTKVNTKNYNINKAFEFANYMVKLSQEGDSDRNILIQTSLQPVFAYNTLILMAQRISEPYYAMIAFNEMKRNKYDIDVFTLTALLDVIGRSNNVNYGLIKSLHIFYDMLQSSNNIDSNSNNNNNNRKLRPNVVTFVTLMRLIGKRIETSSISNDNDDRSNIIDTGKVVLDLLHLAHDLSSKDNHTVGANINEIDMSIYNAALAVTVRSLDSDITIQILEIMKQRNAGSTYIIVIIISIIIIIVIIIIIIIRIE